MLLDVKAQYAFLARGEIVIFIVNALFDPAAALAGVESLAADSDLDGVESLAADADLAGVESLAADATEVLELCSASSSMTNR